MTRNRFHIHRRTAAALGFCAITFIAIGGTIHGAGTTTTPHPTPAPRPPKPAHVRAVLLPCHGTSSPMAGISIEKLATNQISLADGFQTWTRIAAALEGHVMPPKACPAR